MHGVWYSQTPLSLWHFFAAVGEQIYLRFGRVLRRPKRTLDSMRSLVRKGREFCALNFNSVACDETKKGILVVPLIAPKRRRGFFWGEEGEII